MSWFQKSRPVDFTYYTTVAPELYYEWEDNGAIPEKTSLDFGNTRYAKSTDKIVLSIDCDDNYVEKKDNSYIAKSAIPMKLCRFVGGSTKTKEEILDNLKSLQDKYNNGLQRFIEAVCQRQYFIKANSDKANLFWIDKTAEGKPLLKNYGEWLNVIEKAKKAWSQLNTAKANPNHKSIDLTELHALSIALTQCGNNLPFDRDKMLTVIKYSGSEPITTHESNWSELYNIIDKNAQKMKDRVNYLSAFTWVQRGLPKILV